MQGLGHLQYLNMKDVFQQKYLGIKLKKLYEVKKKKNCRAMPIAATSTNTQHPPQLSNRV